MFYTLQEEPFFATFKNCKDPNQSQMAAPTVSFKKRTIIGPRKNPKVVFRFRNPTFLVCSLDYLDFILI